MSDTKWTSTGTATTTQSESDEISIDSTRLMDVSISSRQTSTNDVMKRTNGTVSIINNGRRRKVRFNPAGVRMATTMSAKDMTPEEKQACWYTSDEKARTKDEANELVHSFSMEEFEGLSVDRATFVAKTLERTYASLKKVTRNCAVDDECVVDEEYQNIMNDMFQHPTIVSQSPANREYMQIAHRAMSRWVRHVNHMDETGTETLRGLERFVMNKMDREITPCRHKVLQHYQRLKLMSASNDASARLEIANALSKYAQELSLSHRLYSRIVGDIVAHSTQE
jgi:hypothetical protein